MIIEGKISVFLEGEDVFDLVHESIMNKFNSSINLFSDMRIVTPDGKTYLPNELIYEGNIEIKLC